MARLDLIINGYSIVNEAEQSFAPSLGDRIHIYRSENNGATWEEFCGVADCTAYDGYPSPGPGEWSFTAGEENYNDGLQGFKLNDLVRFELHPEADVLWTASPEDYFAHPDYSGFSALTEYGLFQIISEVTTVGIFPDVVFEERVPEIIPPPTPTTPSITTSIQTQIFDKVTWETPDNERSLVLHIEAEDPDPNDHLIFTATVNTNIDLLSAGVVLDNPIANRGATVTLTPLVGAEFSTSITIRATDTYGEFDEIDFDFIIREALAPPVFVGNFAEGGDYFETVEWTEGNSFGPIDLSNIAQPAPNNIGATLSWEVASNEQGNYDGIDIAIVGNDLVISAINAEYSGELDEVISIVVWDDTYNDERPAGQDEFFSARVLNVNVVPVGDTPVINSINNLPATSNASNGPFIKTEYPESVMFPIEVLDIDFQNLSDVDIQNHIEWNYPALGDIHQGNNDETIAYNWLSNDNIAIARECSGEGTNHEDTNCVDVEDEEFCTGDCIWISSAITTQLTIQPNDFIGTVQVGLTAIDTFGEESLQRWVHFQTLVWPFIDSISDQEITTGDSIVVPFNFGHLTPSDLHTPDFSDGPSAEFEAGLGITHSFITIDDEPMLRISSTSSATSGQTIPIKVTIYDKSLEDWEYQEDPESCSASDLIYKYINNCHPAATTTFFVTILPIGQPQVFDSEVFIWEEPAYGGGIGNATTHIIELSAYLPGSTLNHFTITTDNPDSHQDSGGDAEYDNADYDIRYLPQDYGYDPFTYTVTDNNNDESDSATIHVYVLNENEEWRIQKWEDVFIYPTEINDEFFIDILPTSACDDQYNNPLTGQYCFGVSEGSDVEHDFVVEGMYVSNEMQIRHCTGEDGIPEGDYGIDWTTACEDYAKFVCNVYSSGTWQHPEYHNTCAECVDACGPGGIWHCTPNKLSHCSAEIERTDLSILYSKFYNLLPANEVSELGLEDKILITYNVNSDRFRIRVYDMMFYGIVRVWVKISKDGDNANPWYQSFDLYVNVTEDLYLQPSE